MYKTIQSIVAPMASYIVRLQALTEHCEFSDDLDTMLRDHLVCGVNSEQLKRQVTDRSPSGFHKGNEDLLDFLIESFKIIYSHCNILCCIIDKPSVVYGNANSSDYTVHLNTLLYLFAALPNLQPSSLTENILH